jgi:hypothetical protein
MNENENAEFEEFAAAFGDGDSYHTETEAEEEVQTKEEVVADTEETATDSAEQTDKEASKQTEDVEKTEETESNDSASETFTLKVNKEERSYTRDEVIALAQKGADYDRVKEKLGTQQQTVDALADVAKTMGVEIPVLLENLMINALVKKEGLSEDVARERIMRQKAEKENTALKQAATAKQTEEETSQQRAQREIAEFRKAYPDIPLTDELLKALMPDVQKGVSFKDAYERREQVRKDERIKELEAQLEAEKQNNKNRAASPGSQRDSGGQREKTDFDDFVSAFR